MFLFVGLLKAYLSFDKRRKKRDVEPENTELEVTVERNNPKNISITVTIYGIELYKYNCINMLYRFI